MDIDPEMTRVTSEKAKAAGLTNIVTIERDFVLYGTGLQDGQAESAKLFTIINVG